MRAFIAAEIPAKIRNQLEKIQKQLRQSSLKVSWTKKQNVHLTLVFFKDLQPEQIVKVKKTLRTEEAVTPLSLKTGGLNAFPSLGLPRTIFLEMTGETDRLKAINLKIREKLKREQIPFDPKPFKPHLTLGRTHRLKPWQRKRVSQILKRLPIKQRAKFKITQITLFKSQLHAQGSIYTSLIKIALKNKKC
jgi:2'-5' RNA ligase